jgi:hypothetical protein
MNVNRVEKQTLEIPLWSAFLYVHNNFTSYKRPSKTSGKAPTFTNKKFLETDYPRGRAGYFAVPIAIGIILALGPKPKFCILPHPETPRQSRRGIIKIKVSYLHLIILKY